MQGLQWGRVVDDPPETPWVGYDGLGPNLMIDEHERCESKSR